MSTRALVLQALGTEFDEEYAKVNDDARLRARLIAAREAGRLTEEQIEKVQYIHQKLPSLALLIRGFVDAQRIPPGWNPGPQATALLIELIPETSLPNPVKNQLLQHLNGL